MGMAMGGKGPASEINITPLVDVVLVLLIIFMVITPLMIKQIPIEVPEDVEVEDPEPVKDQLVLTLKENNDMLLNTDTVTLADLEERLWERLKTRPKSAKVVFLDAEDNVPYPNIVQVMDLMKSGGVETIGIVTVELQSSTAIPLDAPAPVEP